MILFRTDGNARIGSGHVMRCLSMAEVLRDRGETCCFVLADTCFQDKIAQIGHPVIVLETDSQNMESELPQLKKFIREMQPSQIVVDSYAVTPEYFRALRQFAPMITYMDDLAAAAYPVDRIINYNIYAEQMGYSEIYNDKGFKSPQMLLGTKYVPLRREFIGVQAKEQPAQCKNILISTGGADPIHLSVKLVEYIGSVKNSNDYRFHFVLGTQNQDAESLQVLSKDIPNIVLHKNVTQMQRLICDCDMAVSAAGSTLYELCACGLPTITYYLADNQISGAESFASQGLMYNLGDLREDPAAAKKILLAIKWLDERFEMRKQMAERMQSVVDGKGTARLAEYLI